MLRDGGDCSGLPGLDYFLYRQHAAAGGDFGTRAGRVTACAWFPAIRRFRFPSPTDMWFRGGWIASGRRRNLERFPRKMRRGSCEVDDQLKKLARYLQPFFMEPPPEIDTSTVSGWSDLFRVGKRFRGISSAEIAQLVSFLTGSLGEFLDHNYESEKMKTMFLANNVYGKHGGPYQPGTAIGLLVSPAERRRARTAGLLRTRDGRHGIDHAGAGCGGKEAGRGDSHFGVGGSDRGPQRARLQRGAGRRKRGSRADDSFERRSEADVS